MKAILVRVCAAFMSLLYALFKLFPVDGRKVLFLSRQSSEPTLDFLLLERELERMCPDVRVVRIFNRVEPGLASKLGFACDLVRSMFHLATCRACVIDSYWPAVSLLRHKPGLTVIQMWHSLGKVKQSGLCVAGRPGGRPADMARALRMHANYDYVIAGAKIWNPFYRDSFGCKDEQILNIGLPRMDVLASGDRAQRREALVRAHPELSGKRIVLYAPTFRRGSVRCHDDLALALEDCGCSLILRSHPNQKLCAQGSIACPDASTEDLLLAADVLITDYSAIALEAAVAGTPTLYYLYDFEEYRDGTGLNINIEEEMPSCVCEDAASVARAVRAALSGEYPYDELERYRSKYLIADRGHSTHDIASLVLRVLDGGRDEPGHFVEEKR